MLLDEWNLDEAKEVWFEEGWEEGTANGLKLAEAKYQPALAENQAIIAENQVIIAEKDRAFTAKDREILELRQRLEAMGQG